MRIISSILAIGFSLLLVSCNNGPLHQNLQAPSFKNLPPIGLNVAEIKVVDEYTSPASTPYVEHLFPTTPAEGVHRWVGERIQARGKHNILEVTIKDASVIAVDLPRTQGIQGVFTKDQAKRYDGKLSVELRIYAPGELMSKANVSADITQSQTIAEDATPVEREALFNNLTLQMLSRMNTELEKNIRLYFNNYQAP